MYCALVLKKNSPYPEMIPLFEEKQLDSLFVKSSSDVNQLYTYRVTNLRKDTAESRLNYGSKLYNLLWKPLEVSLKNTKTVYFAPSGKLNQVAFVAIPVDSTSLLSDKYNLHQVTSTRQVIHNNEQDKQTAKIHDAALFGGIQYELDNKQLAQVQTTTGTNYRSAFVSDSTQRSGSFGYLKGTGEEVTGIAEEFKQKGLTEQLYTGAIASEAAFKKLSGTNTDIIHIATHGFYLPIEDTKPKDFKFMSFDNDRRNVVVHNPLLRSGLAFAGANRAWRGDSIPDNWEDGILTSHEISQLNLTHTDLVVLSACETALGDIKGSEGVFGLQRAFKMAGVQTLIMSLWKVPDKQTSQLMQGFYKYWLGGMSKHDAFKKSQNEIRKANPNPYYWAAFVMVD
jgi:CHAT domain-containing protein